MELPKYHETFTPILEILNTQWPLHYTTLSLSIREKYYSNLPQDLLDQTTTTGTNTLLDRIGRGKSHLKMGKFVDYPSRGIVQITGKGKEILKKWGITLKDLQNDPDFIVHTKAKRWQKDTKDINTLDHTLSPQDLIDQGIKNIEYELKLELLEKLKSSDHFYFQTIILKLLEKIWYGDMIGAPKTRDWGIDGVINKDKLWLEKIYIQAKRYTENKVREWDIRNFIGAMSADTDMGIFVTTSWFDEQAIQKAKNARHKIILIDGNKLVDLMYEYGIWVQIKEIYEIKQIDEDFFEFG